MKVFGVVLGRECKVIVVWDVGVEFSFWCEYLIYFLGCL